MATGYVRDVEVIPGVLCELGLRQEHMEEEEFLAGIYVKLWFSGALKRNLVLRDIV